MTWRKASLLGLGWGEAWLSASRGGVVELLPQRKLAAALVIAVIAVIVHVSAKMHVVQAAKHGREGRTHQADAP